MSNIIASLAELFPAPRLPLYSGRHESEDMTKTDVYPLPEFPDKWKQMPWPRPLGTFFWFTLGQSSPWELWQDAMEKSRSEKRSFDGVAVGQNLVYTASILFKRVDPSVSSSGALWNNTSFMIFGVGVLWFIFFMPLWILKGLYQIDNQPKWKPLSPSLIMFHFIYLAVQRYYFLMSLSAFVCGFYITIMGDNIISYLIVADTIIVIFVVFFETMHR